jgi:thymidylate synthase
MKWFQDALRTIKLEGLDKPATALAGEEPVSLKSYFFIPFKRDLKDGFPLLTTKRVFWKGVLAEAIWFLEGNYSIKNFRYAEYLKFWEPWADSEGRVRSPYGYHWRNYPVLREQHPWDSEAFEVDHIDQISNALQSLMEKPFSKRAGVVLAWHPYNAYGSNQPPCHYTFVLNIGGDGRLNLHWTQRSCDFPIGVPFNIASYALLCHIFAKVLGREPGILAGSFVDAHYYSNQVEGIDELLIREPKELPELIIEAKQLSISNLSHLSMDMFSLKGYNPHPAINFGEVAVSQNKIIKGDS